VYRKSSSGASYAAINSSLVNGTSYVDSTVGSGVSYSYVTTAIDTSNRESDYSNEVTASVP
jgi:fibronectin type 3 domain-containing protein